MIGIKSYGGYIPKRRLQRMSAMSAMGWFAPAIMVVAQGERSMCYWDEDALTMAVTATKDCLKGVDKSQVDGVYLASTTAPFADRSNAGVVKAACNLRDDIVTADFSSCLKAGTSALVTALDAVKGGDKKNVVVTASDSRDTRCAYFYELWFGDGAASLMVGEGDDVIAEHLGSHSVSYDFVDHYRGRLNKWDYMWEERWTRDEGYAKILPEAILGCLKKLNLKIDDIDKIVYPCFFEAEHKNIARKIGVAKEKAATQVVSNMHKECGECGTAHPLVMMLWAMENMEPGQKILVAGFGQGADAMVFQVTDKIKNLAPRDGINGSLANKVKEATYTKYLRWNELLQTEMGIRAEAPTQTAMTTLWRNRKMILGYVGGKCEKCGTKQFPLSKICVNPECNAFHSQVEEEFADKEASVVGFTADMLSVSVEPPNLYGMVDFEGGGRSMVDFSDCTQKEAKVGMKMRMAFRKRYEDKVRGFHGYFWKAVPVPAPAEEKK